MKVPDIKQMQTSAAQCPVTGIKAKSVVFRQILLSAHTTPVNFFAFLLASALTIALFVFVNSTQTFLLSVNLGVPRSELGDLNGSLVFYDQLLSIGLMGFWGAFSDWSGRRVVFVGGFAVMGLAICLFPQASNVYPQLLLIRLLFAVGAAGSSSMMTACLADYVVDRHKPKTSGLLGLCSGLGALLGALGLFAMPSYLNKYLNDLSRSLTISYLAVGIGALIISIALAFTLRPESNDWLTREYWQNLKQSRSSTGTSDETSSLLAESEESTVAPAASSSCPYLAPGDAHKIPTGCTMAGSLVSPRTNVRGFWRLVWEGLVLGCRNPYIMLSYLGGFIARGDSIIITLFLPLWINKVYIDRGLCPDGDSPSQPGFESNPALHACDDAFKQAYIYSGIAQSFALIGAPIFGLISHRIRRRSIPFLLASLISFAGYFSLFFIKDPVASSKTLYPMMALVGWGEIGMIVTSLCLVTSDAYVPAEIRGTVAGTYSLFGGVGLLVSTKLGGVLFDEWTETAPFFVMGILAAVCALASLVVVIRESFHKGTFVADIRDEPPAPATISDPEKLQ